jgi:hypothetical protein
LNLAPVYPGYGICDFIGICVSAGEEQAGVKGAQDGEY